MNVSQLIKAVLFISSLSITLILSSCCGDNVGCCTDTTTYTTGCCGAGSW